MQNIRVDQSDFIRPRLVADPEPVTDFETGEIKVNPKTGERDYRLAVAVRREGQRRASLIEVKVRSLTAPEVAEGDVVILSGLAMTYWEQGDRSGLSFRAESVTKAPDSKGVGSAPASSAAPSPTAATSPMTRAAAKGGDPS